MVLKNLLLIYTFKNIVSHKSLVKSRLNHVEICYFQTSIHKLEVFFREVMLGVIIFRAKILNINQWVVLECLFDDGSKKNILPSGQNNKTNKTC